MHDGRLVRRLGDYHLLKKLGQGGMGAVFLAKRLGVGGFEKTFVVKCMLESLAGSEELITMFFDEARLAARLSHPNIAQIYDFGVIDGTYYIAMEHIAGEDLSGIIEKLKERNVRIPLQMALRIMLELCAGLDYAHNLSEDDKPLRIVHRDVSPSNVMVSYQGAVKLLDFGIAKTSSRISETRTGGIKGKLSYLAPEQIQDLPIDARVDIFCMGITFFKLLTHLHPFRRETEIGTMHAIVAGNPTDARTLRTNLPESVVAILGKALAGDREKRFQSAAEMAVALRSALSIVAPGHGTPDLARFMITLFGREAMARRSHVPTVGEINLADVVSPKVTASFPAFNPSEARTQPNEARTQRIPNASATTMQMPAFTPLGRVEALLARPRARRLAAAGAAVLVALGILLWAQRRASRGRAIHKPTGAVTVASPSLPSTGREPIPVAAPPLLSPIGPQAAAGWPIYGPPAAGPRRAPRPRAAVSAEGPGRLSGAVLQAVVVRSHPRFVACFRQHAAELSATSGQATVELTVASTGQVSSASARLPTFKAPALGRCLEEEALRLRFPRHADREIRFAFPLVYRKGQ
jgi:serine/threonine protein kinase